MKLIRLFALLAVAVLAAGVAGSWHGSQDPVMPQNEEFNVVLTTSPSVVYYQFEVKSPATNTSNVFFFNLECMNAASTASFGAMFNFGSRPSIDSQLHGVQTTEYTAPTGSFVKEFVISSQFIQTGQWFVGIQNGAGQQLNCVGFAFVAPEMNVQLATSVSLALNPPTWTILVFDLPPADLMTVTVRDLRADGGTTVLLASTPAKYPSSDTPLASPAQSSARMSQRSEFQVPTPQITRGRNYIALFVQYNGFVEPVIPIIITISASNLTALQTGKTVSSEINPLDDDYYSIDIPYESSALLLRFVANSEFVPAPFIAVEEFPNYANSLQAPSQVFEEYDSSNPTSIVYYAIVESDVLTATQWKIRVLNTQTDSGLALAYTLTPTIADEASVLLGERIAAVLNPGEATLFRLIASGNTNLFYITIIAKQRVDLKLRPGNPPTSINSFASNVTVDIEQGDDGLYYQHYVYFANEALSNAGMWYGLVVPTQPSTEPISYTFSWTASWESHLREYSHIGGRVDPYGADYFRYDVDPDVGSQRGLYLKVESSGAMPRILTQQGRLPTPLNYFSDGLVQSSYQYTWSPVSGISEAYIPEAKLVAGPWFAQVAGQDPSARLSYSLIAILFDTFTFSAAGKTEAFTMSADKMVVLVYDHTNASTDIFISITPGDKLDVVAKMGQIPCTFDADPSAKLAVNVAAADNTLTYTVRAAAIGKWYFRVSADTFIKTIQATINVGALPTNPTPTPTSSPNSNLDPNPTNILAWVLIPLACIFIILGIVVLILFLRKRQAIANADLEYQLLGKDKDLLAGGAAGPDMVE